MYNGGKLWGSENIFFRVDLRVRSEKLEGEKFPKILLCIGVLYDTRSY